jgi:surface antigen
MDMPTTEKTFETIPVGTNVTWHYRSAIGHGTVIGVHKMGTTADDTMYIVRHHDHLPGEPAFVHHSGKALRMVKS